MAHDLITIKKDGSVDRVEGSFAGSCLSGAKSAISIFSDDEVYATPMGTLTLAVGTGLVTAVLAQHQGVKTGERGGESLIEKTLPSSD